MKRLPSLTRWAVPSIAVLALLTSCTQTQTRGNASLPPATGKSLVVLPVSVSVEGLIAEKSDTEKARIRRALSEAVALQLEGDLRRDGHSVTIVGLAGPEDQAEQTPATAIAQAVFRGAEAKSGLVTIDEETAGSLGKLAAEHKAEALVLAELVVAPRLAVAPERDQDHLAVGLEDSEANISMQIQQGGGLLDRAFAVARVAVFDAAAGRIVWSNSGRSRPLIRNATTPGLARRLAAEALRPFVRSGTK